MKIVLQELLIVLFKGLYPEKTHDFMNFLESGILFNTQIKII